ncbi:hypothetical protein TNCV_2898971 [Trichonephila clavipes]|nr:hypothetical protein TNCV_2898971 [Trichonephila clavipes]
MPLIKWLFHLDTCHACKCLVAKMQSNRYHKEDFRMIIWRDSVKMYYCDCVVRKSVIDEAHFWLNGMSANKAAAFGVKLNPQVHVETPLHPEKLFWCALWAGGILLQKR